MNGSEGRLAVVLHSHMPYVEGFGTWPFGEEWLWEAIATCYLPLLELLEEGAPVTLSITPVLADQLEAPDVGERFLAFLGDVRARTHVLDVEGLRAGGEHGLTDVLGPGTDAHLRPLRSEAGPLLVPIDRETIELVWSHGGYPSHGSYRDYHHHTIHHHRPWGNDGSPYDHRAALALAREHAADF